MNKPGFEKFILELEDISSGIYMLCSVLEVDTDGMYADAARGSWRHLSRIIADMRGELEAWK